METPDDLAMPFLLMSAFRGLVDAVHEQLAAAGFEGIRVTHGFAMQAIGHGCTSAELGERLGVTKQAAAKTAQTLETMGLIVRQVNVEDRRERTLLPTARGAQMLSESARAFRSETQKWRETCGDEALAVTLRTLAGVPHGSRGQLNLADWA